MAEVYTRHTKSCGRKNRHDHKCGCPLWIYHNKLRWSAGTNDWDAAIKKAGELGSNSAKPTDLTVEEAVNGYLVFRTGCNDPAEAYKKACYRDT